MLCGYVLGKRRITFCIALNSAIFEHVGHWSLYLYGDREAQPRSVEVTDDAEQNAYDLTHDYVSYLCVRMVTL